MYRTFDEAYDWEVDDPVTVALVGSRQEASSPAWDRLNALCRARTHPRT